MPFGFSLRIRLLVAYHSAEVCPGPKIPCGAWIEPDGAPDKSEFYAQLGFDVGLRFGPVLLRWPELSQRLDFCSRTTAWSRGPPPGRFHLTSTQRATIPRT